MLKAIIFNSFFFVFILQILLHEQTIAKTLETCYGNPGRFSNPNTAAEIYETIKSLLIQDPQIKTQIIDNSAELQNIKQQLSKCIEEFMRANQFRILEKMTEEVLEPLNLDLGNQIKLIGHQIKKEIDGFVDKIHAKKNTQIVTPVFQWVQNYTNLFLQIKFAHRHDAPGCLEIKNEIISFSPTGFYFSAFGVQAQQPIHFVLNLTFFQEIIPEKSFYNFESVGRLFVNVAKAKKDVWVFLLKDNEKLPGMRIWWEMKDLPLYKNAMKRYDQLVEEQERLEEEARRKGKKGKKQEEMKQDKKPFDDDL